jgi:hypothetical protein
MSSLSAPCTDGRKRGGTPLFSGLGFRSHPCRPSRGPRPRRPSLRPARAHLSRRRPRLPASSASRRQPRPSGARSKLSLSLRSSGSRRRLRVAPAGRANDGPEGAAEGGGACSGSPHSDMARAGRVLPRFSLHLPLAPRPPLNCGGGRKTPPRAAALSGGSSAPNPPERDRFAGESSRGTRRAEGRGLWGRGLGGASAARLRAAAPSPPRLAWRGAPFKPCGAGRDGWVLSWEETVEELRPGGSSTPRKPAASGLPGVVGGGLPHAGEGSRQLPVVGPHAPAPGPSALG